MSTSPIIESIRHGFWTGQLDFNVRAGQTIDYQRLRWTTAGQNIADALLEVPRGIMGDIEALAALNSRAGTPDEFSRGTSTFLYSAGYLYMGYRVLANESRDDTPELSMTDFCALAAEVGRVATLAPDVIEGISLLDPRPEEGHIIDQCALYPLIVGADALALAMSNPGKARLVPHTPDAMPQQKISFHEQVGRIMQAHYRRNDA